jgi:hypothetical protein
VTAHGSEALELGLVSWMTDYRKWKASPSLGQAQTRMMETQGPTRGATMGLLAVLVPRLQQQWVSIM